MAKDNFVISMLNVGVGTYKLKNNLHISKAVLML